MQPQNHSYSSENQLDFSSALMRATSSEPFSAIDNLQEDFDHIKVNHNRSDNNIRENRNISSILTNIRDDVSTPSYAQKNTARKNTTKKTTPDTKPSAAAQAKAHTELPDSAVFHAAHENGNNFFHENSAPTKKSRLSLWQPLALSLALTITVIMGYNLFQLHMQTNELQLTLSRYEERINELSSAQEPTTPDPVPELDTSSVNADLTHLKQQIAAIRSDLASKETSPKPDEIVHIEPQLQAPLLVKPKEKTAIASPAKTSPIITNSDMSAYTPNKWHVNLATYSSKEQLQFGLSLLEKSGKIPAVREITLNGATAYRLSVEGFSTYKKASQFASTVKKNYGFDSGWIGRTNDIPQSAALH